MHGVGLGYRINENDAPPPGCIADGDTLALTGRTPGPRGGHGPGRLYGTALACGRWPFYWPAATSRPSACGADKARRFQTAAEFIKALEALAQRAGWPLTVEALRPLLGG